MNLTCRYCEEATDSYHLRWHADFEQPKETLAALAALCGIELPDGYPRHPNGERMESRGVSYSAFVRGLGCECCSPAWPGLTNEPDTPASDDAFLRSLTHLDGDEITDAVHALYG